jgi:SAM-dependent methyltransferase
MKSHEERLYNYYYKRGFKDDIIKKIVKQKIQKIQNNRDDDFENYSSLFLKNELKEITGNTKTNYRILDIGCGTGEIIYLLSKLFPNIKVDGVEPYESERNIAGLLLDESKIDGKIYESVNNALEKNIYDAVIFMSVTEHMSDTILNEIIRNLKKSKIIKIFILVPNKYKIRDDHTNIPYISLFNHWTSGKILQIINKKYILSEGSIWDVWYRTAYQYVKILENNNYNVKFLGDNDVFPSIKLCKPIKLNIKDFKNIVDIKYILPIIFRFFAVSHKYDHQPYLNIIATHNNENL